MLWAAELDKFPDYVTNFTTVNATNYWYDMKATKRENEVPAYGLNNTISYYFFGEAGEQIGASLASLIIDSIILRLIVFAFVHLLITSCKVLATCIRRRIRPSPHPPVAAFARRHKQPSPHSPVAITSRRLIPSSPLRGAAALAGALRLSRQCLSCFRPQRPPLPPPHLTSPRGRSAAARRLSKIGTFSSTSLACRPTPCRTQRARACSAPLESSVRMTA